MEKFVKSNGVFLVSSIMLIKTKLTKFIEILKIVYQWLNPFLISILLKRGLVDRDILDNVKILNRVEVRAHFSE